ncbi:MAG: ABC transporter permease, partial [Thermaurantiacus tibetensis]
SVAITLILGFPVGILAGSSRLVRAVVTPLLDAMQTMPAFVYLVPAIFFFGVGATTAIMATVIYALPPIIRMTSHGLRSTPDNLIEVADSFGASPLQIFLRVRLPHALGAVLVGVNQTIMMALGLVVLAAMVGAPGLGTEIWLALQKLNVGKALEGGICIVFMAMLLDRLMDAATGP